MVIILLEDLEALGYIVFDPESVLLALAVC